MGTLATTKANCFRATQAVTPQVCLICSPSSRLALTQVEMKLAEVCPRLTNLV